MLIQVYFYQTNFRDDEPARSATEAAPTRWCPASCALDDALSVIRFPLHLDASAQGLVRGGPRTLTPPLRPLSPTVTRRCPERPRAAARGAKKRTLNSLHHPSPYRHRG